MMSRLLDLLLGPTCPLGCGHRARIRQAMAWHVYIDHADGQ